MFAIIFMNDPQGYHLYVVIQKNLSFYWEANLHDERIDLITYKKLLSICKRPGIVDVINYTICTKGVQFYNVSHVVFVLGRWIISHSCF